MAAEDLDILRSQLPDLFDDRRVNGEAIEDAVVIPVDHLPEGLSGFIDELIEQATGPVSDGIVPFWGTRDTTDTPRGSRSRRRDPLSRIARGDFPGKYRAPSNWRPGNRLPPLAPDSLAFYLPFHYSQPYWGIYAVLEYYIAFCASVRHLTHGQLSAATIRAAVDGFLYGHEIYHHRVECFATRMEIIHRRPLYRTRFEALYRRRHIHPDSVEEGLATAGGLMEANSRLKLDPRAQAEVARVLRDYVIHLPIEYQVGLKLLKRDDFDRRENDFNEANHLACFPVIAKKSGPMPDIWNVFTFANRGFIHINSPFSFMIPRGSPLFHRVVHSFKCLTARDVRRRITQLGDCKLVRQGGRHEVWHCAKTGETVEIPRHPGDLKPGTLASIAKRACDMNLHQFTRADL